MGEAVSEGNEAPLVTYFHQSLQKQSPGLIKTQGTQLCCLQLSPWQGGYRFQLRSLVLHISQLES